MKTFAARLIITATLVVSVNQAFAAENVHPNISVAVDIAYRKISADLTDIDTVMVCSKTTEIVFQANGVGGGTVDCPTTYLGKPATAHFRILASLEKRSFENVSFQTLGFSSILYLIQPGQPNSQWEKVDASTTHLNDPGLVVNIDPEPSRQLFNCFNKGMSDPAEMKKCVAIGETFIAAIYVK